MRRFLPIFVLLVTTLLTGSLPVSAKQAVSGGVFTDREGKTHSWTINSAHTLIWGDKPFVPVGGRFQVRSWSPRSTEADYQADITALEVLKQNRITDLYLQPARGGITGVSVTAIQRIVDYLDKEGFTYGVSINDAPQELLAGYEIRPGKYRNVAPTDGGNLRFPIDTLTSAMYFLVSENGQEILQTGEATMVAEGARVTVDAIPGKNVVFLLPKKAFFGAANIGVPNLWEGFDNYRDTLLAHLRKVKFGTGFRFFLDPLPADLRFSEAFEAFVPLSPAFGLEWSEWLARRYKSLEALQTAWAISDRPLRQFNDAVNMIPLWGGGKGVEFLYDLNTGTQHRVSTSRSEYWRDLALFKQESTRGYMNDLATALKKAVANVPVVYRSSGYSPLFNNLPANRGFDGIGISAYGRGSDLVTRAGGYAYAQAAEANKTLWLPVVATADAPTSIKNTTGYTSQNAMHVDLDWLREIGARGFYVDSVRTTDPTAKFYDLSTQPDQLQWLAAYADVLSATGVSGLDRVPTTLFYPRGLGIETASLRPLPGGGWWLPTDRPGVFYEFGPCGRAYALSETDGSIVYYLWNPEGRRTIHLKIPKAANAPGASTIRASAAAQGVVKKDVLTLTIGPDPIRLERFPTIPVPTEAFKELLLEIGKMLALLERQKSVDTARFQLQLSGVQSRYNPDNPILSINEALRARQELRDALRPYAWLEAERAVSQSFDAVLNRFGASGRQILSVEDRLPGAPIASAAYSVTVRSEGTFNIWVAASPDAPLTLRINGKPLIDEATLPQKVGAPYADGTLIWHRYGSATLPKGTHTIELRANGPALIDTLLIIQGDFKPNGPTPPPIMQ